MRGPQAVYAMLSELRYVKRTEQDHNGQDYLSPLVVNNVISYR